MFSDVIESIPVSEYQKNLSCGQQFRGAFSVPALVTESLPAPASSVSTGQPDLPGHVHQETAMATGAYVATRRDGQFAFPLEPAATGESQACTQWRRTKKI